MPLCPRWLAVSLSMVIRSPFAVVTGLVIGTFVVPAVRGNTYTWIATTSGSQWANASSWAPTGHPGVGDTVVFIRSSAALSVSTSSIGATAGVLTFQNAGNSTYTISGTSPLFLNNGNLDAQINEGFETSSQTVAATISF